MIEEKALNILRKALSSTRTGITALVQHTISIKYKHLKSKMEYSTQYLNTLMLKIFVFF